MLDFDSSGENKQYSPSWLINITEYDIIDLTLSINT